MPNIVTKARVAFGVCLLLTAAAYWSVVTHGFVDYDDQVYVTQNIHVQAGLTADGLSWAFRTHVLGNWHPLTWISHMLDSQWFGMRAGGHHLTNLLLHLANALLLFRILERTTGSSWKSAFVAAAFALHPLHVESVAWIAERKDVLSTFFGFLSVLFYTRYVEAEPGRPSRKWQFYALAIACFALALMSKAMLVTLPFLLLLLDFWPLRRIPFETDPAPGEGSTRVPWRRIASLVVEKIPWFALAAADSVLTFVTQKQSATMVLILPPELRLDNAIVSYARYLAKTFWPTRLVAFYPFPTGWPSWIVIVCALSLVGITVLALLSWRRRPYLAVGWLWYVGTLIPVIGLVQVGAQSIADRYTYLPSIGLFLILAWGLSDLLSPWRFSRFALGIASAVALSVCALLTARQVAYWKDSLTLFQHALAVAPNNVVAQYSVGCALVKAGKRDEALPHFTEAVKLKPNYGEALNYLGLLQFMKGNVDEAISSYRAALEAEPGNPKWHFNLAIALAANSDLDGAASELKAALRLDPGFSQARYQLARLLTLQGKRTEAKAQYLEFLRREPGAVDVDRYAVINAAGNSTSHQPCKADAHMALGLILAAEKDYPAAVSHLEEAARLRPGDFDVHFELGSVLAEQGALPESARELEAALGLSTNHWEAHDRLGLVFMRQDKPREGSEQFAQAAGVNPTNVLIRSHLAMALDRLGRTREAIEQYQEALNLNPMMPVALNNLAWILAANPDSTNRNGVQAVRLARRACELTDFQEPLMVGTLAAAYAEAGRFDEALQLARRAESMATAAGRPQLADKDKQMAELFLKREAFHETK